MSNLRQIDVEVAYALPHTQRIVKLAVNEGTTARQAAMASGLQQTYPGIDLAGADLGVFGKSVDGDAHVLRAGERVEIYRPLLIDPKEVRKQRAAKAAKKT